MKILSVANFTEFGNSSTAKLRHKALCQIKNYQVDSFDTYFRYGLINRIINKLFQYGINFSFFGVKNINKMLLEKIASQEYNILWIDKGIAVKSNTLSIIKKQYPKLIIIGYSPDEMTLRHNQSADFLNSLPLYDAYITTKLSTVKKMEELGAKKVYFVNKSYEPTFHFPRDLNDSDKIALCSDIGFIGAWEYERASSILYLAEKGLSIRVWGGGRWLQYKDKYKNLIIEEKGLYSEDYCKALSGFKINLCFLRKINNDQQTARTMEIPACRGFMLAERTIEHQMLFEEDKEAVFFSSNQELYEKCLYYLDNDDIRNEVALSGYMRCQESGYSNQKTLQKILNKILEDF